MNKRIAGTVSRRFLFLLTRATQIFAWTLKLPWFISDLYSDFAPSRHSPPSVTQWACTCQQMTSPGGTCTTYREPHLNFIMSRATCSRGWLLEARNFRGFRFTFIKAFQIRRVSLSLYISFYRDFFFSFLAVK